LPIDIRFYSIMNLLAARLRGISGNYYDFFTKKKSRSKLRGIKPQEIKNTLTQFSCHIILCLTQNNVDNMCQCTFNMLYARRGECLKISKIVEQRQAYMAR
jgi:hypothetical protein